MNLAVIYGTGPDGATYPIDALPDGSMVMALAADARQGALFSIEITLSATPGTVTTLTIPDSARGFCLFPRNGNARFAVNENPAAVGASSATSIAASAMTAGGIAKQSEWVTRLIEAGTSRTIRLRSLTASLILDLEVF
jgi:hypothetical protein